MQNNIYSILIVCALFFSISKTQAALEEGEIAPAFSSVASLAGKPFQFTLSEKLKNGPVVLYFYPKAFTQGCTIEAHEFAEATEEFAQYNTTVIGMSSDNIETLHEFSASECRDKFAVAADPEGEVIHRYDAAIKGRANLIAARISYVIAPDGRILNVLESSSPHGHITESMAAVKSWWAQENSIKHSQ